MTTPSPGTSPSGASFPSGAARTALTATEARVADALFERLFPADDDGPGARAIGVLDYVDRALAGHDSRHVPLYQAVLASLDASARSTFGHGFADLRTDQQDALVQHFSEGGLDAPLGPEEQQLAFAQVRAHLQEGLFADPAYGGNRDAAGWRLLGHPGVWLENSAEENLSSDPVTKGGVVRTLADVADALPHDEAEEEWTREAYRNALSQSTEEVDVLLVGVGAMGGLVAQTFAEAGLSVVGLEAGPWRAKDDFRPDELGDAYYARAGLGPKFQTETPRWRQDADDAETLEATFSLGRMVNGVGGSAGHYGAWLRRFHPWHFRPLTRITEQYGRDVLPEDCTLADWPVTYDELEPYYTRLEHLIGVAGDESNPYIERSKPLPMPPMRPFSLGERFRTSTEARGLHPHSVPVGVNTVEYGGRPATTYSAWSNGLGTSSGERWHPGLGPVPQALRTGRFELRTHCRVTRVLLDSTGKAVGVEYLDPNGRVRTQHARAVILSAYTYENLRLMFVSADSKHPDGLGNSTGQLGKHYMTKMFAHVNGYFPGVYFNRHTGPAAQGVVLDDYVAEQFDFAAHGFLGGATLGAEQQFLPLQISRECLPPEVRPWGRSYRDHLLRWQHQGVVRIQSDSLPYAGHFVDLDPRHRDRSGVGMPVVRITYRLRENERRLAAWMGEQADMLLREMGAATTWEGPHFTGVGSSHDLGGTRFGEDPTGTVLDPWLAVHDTPGLHVYGGSAFPSCPGINPTLTIWAVVLRAAEKLARDLGGSVA
ncbi:gluconate 2-dehydrogenase subunit 3 family protein [Streptomyces xiangluensis]|uniref:Gluconate 2-dehydrogenase subunit 3 family protein n=1 Tax=Streptomyces xiangluensis TaxID=2665720 RepID=A0ABV8YUP5_9ACTN